MKAAGYRRSEGPDEIERHRRIWQTKPQVRSFYELQVFPRVVRALPARGPIVEIGSGAGIFSPDGITIVSTDVIDSPWLDLRCSAAEMPFLDFSLGAIVAVNVLHHLPSLGPFLKETARVLGPSGRCVCVEPWITPLSGIFYRWCHHEGCRPVPDPFVGPNTAADLPMDGNTYVPFQAFGPGAATDLSGFGLRLVSLEVFGGVGWCLSMGFRETALLPDRWLRPLLRWEDKTSRVWTKWAGLSSLIVLERV
jgi:SAM-dependent methyltransferase